jgi:hypothetical protein
VTDINTGPVVMEPPSLGVAHRPLPVHGYTPQSDDKVQTVNVNKIMEEQILKRLDWLAKVDGTDGRWLAIARTHIEQGFMAMNRAVFRPARLD